MRRINGDLIEISDTVRIERGPERKQAIATKELLDDEVTASHYQVGAVDAENRVIEIGKPMSYIDWLNPKMVWYVYKLVAVDEQVNGEVVKVERFQPTSSFDGEAEAVVFAMGL